MIRSRVCLLFQCGSPLWRAEYTELYIPKMIPLEEHLDNTERTERQAPLSSFHVGKMNGVIAITTPIPDGRGNISTRTPIYHLPVYNVDLTIGDKATLNLKCDLADMTDLVAKLRELKNQWGRS